MKKITPLAIFLSLLFIGCLQAADIPFVELEIEHNEDTAAIMDAQFSRDGKTIVTEDADSIFRIWDAETGKELQKIKPDGFLMAVEFSADGKRLITVTYICSDQDRGGDVVQIWDIGSGKEVKNFKLGGTFADISRDSKKIASASFVDDEEEADSSEGIYFIWDVESGEKLQTLDSGMTGEGCGVYSAVFSPGGKRVVTLSRGKNQLWDTVSGKELQAFGDEHFIDFTPNGRKMVFADNEMIRIRDAASGEELQETQGRKKSSPANPEYFYAADFSPDGEKIVTISYSDQPGEADTVRIFDLSSGKVLRTLNAPGLLFWSAKFSPDGKKLITASLDGAVRIWDADSGKGLRKLAGKPVDFLPEGKKKVSDMSGYTQVLVLDSEGKPQYTEGLWAAFSPDGKSVFTANYTEEITRIFDADSGKELHQLEGAPTDRSQDKKKIVTVNDDAVRVWTLP